MKQLRRIVALLLCICMMLSIAACSAPAQKQEQVSKPNQSTQSDKLDRDDKELVAELIGGQDASDLTDEELDQLVDELVGADSDDASSDIVNLGTDKKEEPTVDSSEYADAYDENGAMKEPFDQVYPELIEQEMVAFSGESILIKLESDQLTDGLKAAGVGTLEVIVPMEGASWYEAKLVEGTDVHAALKAVRKLDETLLAEYNYEVQTAAIDAHKDFDEDHDFGDNDHHKHQWHMHHCGIPDGMTEMQTNGGSSSVIVAVIDTGVDYDHEDLKDNIWVNTGEVPDNGLDDDGNGYIDDYYGVNIVAGRGNGDDDNGHGTHVAGIIAAQNNNLGVVGIAYNVKIMPVKAAMASGTLNQSDVAKAILYAYDMGAEVINMSFGGSACSIAVQDALAIAYRRCVLVASAGNDGKPNEATDNYLYSYIPNYPAALTYVLGVMSVDQYGVESAFTNWDAKAFNGVEYELSAPGDAIMSTLPGDRYGFLSGTSMAAPVVSAMAAILRSEYSDRDMYPNKFIYGQLCSTSGYTATCLDPEDHQVNGACHDLAQIVNLYDALTKLPKPEVSMQDYNLFDTESIADVNNSDGVIDAGETIALGLTLRNRWGMSENTIVTIDALNNGVADPYVTIENPSVNYGSVGTYSTQNCGAIYTDELLTGWENPFYITIAKDCPNDYIIKLNVTVTCENALDAEDNATYRETAEIWLYVRNGVVLPQIIDEDMVLTPDNLYIIPNSTVINEGVTVRVEPGTHIQFWSADAEDPYADSYIAYLLVNGNFLVEGTKENPVYIYPSDLMSNYNIEMGAGRKGYISLVYADVCNLACHENDSFTNTKTFNKIQYAEHCTFRQNYEQLLYRRINSGTIEDHRFYSACLLGNLQNAKNCVFYKVSYDYLIGDFDGCIFVDCAIDYQKMISQIAPSYRNCVFLGNKWGSNNSTMQLKDPSMSTATFNNKVVYNADTGTTYLRFNIPFINENVALYYSLVAYVERELGGTFCVIETVEEFSYLLNQGAFDYESNSSSTRTVMGLRKGPGNDVYWSDGTLVGDFITRDFSMSYSGVAFEGIGFRGSYICNPNYTSSAGVLFEIPGIVLPTDITFEDYAVEMDLEQTYQLEPVSAPVPLGKEYFIFESTDESVLTVSDTGVVTPVGTGTADVYVYYQDRAIWNHVSFTVSEHVALDAIALSESTLTLGAGNAHELTTVLSPVDTTRKNVAYTSSDEAIVTVDAYGKISAVGVGTATITAECDGKTAQVSVNVVPVISSLTLDQVNINVALSDGIVALPNVVTEGDAQTELVWESLDESVATIENGKVKLVSAGTTTLRVTDRISGKSASALLVVRENGVVGIQEVYLYSSAHFVLMENGTLYFWNNNITVPTVVATDVVLFDNYSGNYFATVHTDGSIKSWNINGTAITTMNTYTDLAEKEIAGLEYSYMNESDIFWVYTTAGELYVWGDNSWGRLGTGDTEYVAAPTLSTLTNVKDVIGGSTVFILTGDGKLYTCGYQYYYYYYDTKESGNVSTYTPEVMAEGVESFLDDSIYGGMEDVEGVYYEWNAVRVNTTDGLIREYGTHGYATDIQLDISQFDDVSVKHYWVSSAVPNGIAIQDGKVYKITGKDENGNCIWTQIPGIANAVSVHNYSNMFYVITADGQLLFYGNNSTYYNNTLGESTATTVTKPVMVPVEPIADQDLEVIGSEMTPEGVLKITFNKAIHDGVGYFVSFAEAVNSSWWHEIVNDNEMHIHFDVTTAAPVDLEVLILAGTVDGVAGATNSEEIVVKATYTTITHTAVLNITIERTLTVDKALADYAEFIEETQINGEFYGNAILNRISTDTNVDNWLRIVAPEASSYTEIPLGGNYWGSTNETAIGLQMVDYADYITYARLMYKPFLQEAPENTFPFVTSVTILNKDGEAVTTVGNEPIIVRVTFNRDMDTSIPLNVCFGSAEPYADYTIPGAYVDARTWEGAYTLNTLIENGNQYWNISNGCSATDDLELFADTARFGFVIDTTAAQALIMQGNATDTGIQLTWTQDDFDTLMGYNVYRSTSEDGYYQRLNATVIPADTMQWFDDTVEPGVVYYYNFTVVKTDLTESEPSGKITIMSKDTMAPNIYHSPVYSAFTNTNLIVTATVTDNLYIASATVYFRVTGETEWRSVAMTNNNSKYSAIIPAEYLSTEGMEYYIEAFDGVSYTYKGSAEVPYAVTVQEAIDANSLGDVDGNGIIDNLDALLLLYAINDKYNLTAEEFARADLNGDGQLWAAEALRILQYASGVVGSVKM